MAVRVQVPPSAPSKLPIRQSYESPDVGAFVYLALADAVATIVLKTCCVAGGPSCENTAANVASICPLLIIVRDRCLPAQPHKT